MSESEFNRLAHDAEAIYKLDKKVLIKVALIDDYMEYFRLRNRMQGFVRKAVDFLVTVKYNVVQVIKGGARIGKNGKTKGRRAKMQQCYGSFYGQRIPKA